MTNLTKIALFAGLSLVACERRENTNAMRDQTPGTPTPVEEKKAEDLGKGGGPMAPMGAATERTQARDRLANARCEHYKSCGDIAKGKKFDTVESCVTREKADLDKDWKMADCPKVDTPRLDACIAAVNAEKCGLFSSTPSECKESKVCIK
ncbi:MAG: DUF6184 family natural product biosynthesis lipoprotein [Polyangiales bacterium]